MIHFENRHEKLASPEVYRRRLVRSGSFGLLMVVVSLFVGMAGYSCFEHLGFVDAFENAAMILSGMGPLWDPKSTGGKLFAGVYALYSGFAVLVIAAIMFGPVVHRIMHRFHIEEREAQEKKKKS
ncbi:MAG TPA: hypothetical protein VKR38_01060 [Usitatibacter sp.]|nr:hypothetical protein [Usitatibacter sp.]